MNTELLRRRMDKFFATTTTEELINKLDARRGSGCAACRMVASGVKSRKRLPHTCEQFKKLNVR